MDNYYPHCNVVVEIFFKPPRWKGVQQCPLKHNGMVIIILSGVIEIPLHSSQEGEQGAM